MADPVDIGNNTAAYCTAEAERRARGKSGPEHDPGFNGLDCVDCLEPIHGARLALGKIRCIECQQVLEQQERMKRH